MVRIDKTGYQIPDILTTDGTAKKDEHINAYENEPGGFGLHTRERTKFQFENDIYGHNDVKTLLKEIQSHKCCFCEAKVDHISHGDIEHFRPKAAYKQDKASQIEYPGYFWLSYEWENLYFSCQVCNEREKKKYFPLVNNGNRADPINRDITNEEPIFIDPSGDGLLDPERHIYYIAEEPAHLSYKGKITIEYLGLDREELNKHRQTALNRMRALEQITQLTRDSDNADQARSTFIDNLRLCVNQDSEYSSMFKSNFQKYLTEL